MAESVNDPFAWGLDHRIIEIGKDGTRAACPLVKYDLENAGERRLNRRSVHLAVALRSMRIADRKKTARRADGKKYLGVLAQTPIVEVAAEIGRRNGIDVPGLFRREGDESEMQSRWN